MKPLVLGDPAWLATFPHRVAPKPGESLVSLLLRCDEENHWESGTTHTLLAHALQLIREKLKKEKVVYVRLLDGKIKRVEHYELTKASLGFLVGLLVSLDLSLASSC